MRLLAGLTAAALSGLAVGASQPSADAYLFKASSSQSSPNTPSIPKEVARHILLQRTSGQRYGSDLRDLPSSIDTETAVGHIAKFGKSPAPLFSHTKETEPSQLVVIVEGVAAEQSSRLRETLGHSAAYTIADPPSATANKFLMAGFHNMGVASPRQCELSEVINPFKADCWNGPSAVVKYDLRKSPTTLDSLVDNLPRLNNFVNNGELEVLLVLLPESSRNSKLNHWSATAAGAGSWDSASDLRRRRHAEETVITDHQLSTDAESDNGEANHPPAATAAATTTTTLDNARRTKKPIPQCFASYDGCMAQTNSCSGHGECANKYGGNTTSSASAASCFACVCKASVVEPGDGARAQGRRTVHWGGNTCQKEDVSVEFWLIAGFTVTIVGAVTFAIGLLFNVGEEKLPGVIGAGVSRSK